MRDALRDLRDPDPVTRALAIIEIVAEVIVVVCLLAPFFI